MNGMSAALRQAQGERNEFIFEANSMSRAKRHARQFGGHHGNSGDTILISKRWVGLSMVSPELEIVNSRCRSERRGFISKPVETGLGTTGNGGSTRHRFCSPQKITAPVLELVTILPRSDGNGDILSVSSISPIGEWGGVIGGHHT
jgi:hypothetical protein